MTDDQVRGERMARQRLIGEPFESAVGAVRHLTAVQAQEFDDACRAVTRRVAGRPDPTDVAREAAAGAIVRHHVLRPTWHFVLADELDWLLDLTAERIHALARPQYRTHGILDDLDRWTGLVGEVLGAAETPLTRKEIGVALADRGTELPKGALAHLTFAAELDKVATTGPRRGTWDTFVPYRSRIPETAPIDRDEAVARLAERYLQGHAPATPHDFAWWSGLTVTDAKRAFEQVDLEPQQGEAVGTAMLISLFDEYVIAYRDRTIYAAPTARGGTLDVWGGDLAIVDGVVVGTWRLRKPKRKADPATLEITATAPIAARTRQRLEADAHRQLQHHPIPYEITWKEATP